MPKEKLPKLLGYAVDTPRMVVGRLDDWTHMTEIGNIDINEVHPDEPTYIIPEGIEYAVTSGANIGRPGKHFGKFNNPEAAEAYRKNLSVYANALVPKHYAEEAAQQMPSSPLPLGMVARGNIDLDRQQAGDFFLGTYFEKGSSDYGKTALIPSSIGGTQMNPEAAIARYQTTGEHGGIFNDVVAAQEFSDKLKVRRELALEGTGGTRPGDEPWIQEAEEANRGGRPEL